MSVLGYVSLDRDMWTCKKHTALLKKYKNSKYDLAIFDIKNPINKEIG